MAEGFGLVEVGVADVPMPEGFEGGVPAGDGFAGVAGLFGVDGVAVAAVDGAASDFEAAWATTGLASTLRGFKFKVQHPVLGYWRLLKKLHRVS